MTSMNQSRTPLLPQFPIFADFMRGWYPPFKLWMRYYRPIGVAPKHEGEGVVNINETIDSAALIGGGAMQDIGQKPAPLGTSQRS